MSSTELRERLDELIEEKLPLPGAGSTPARFKRLFEVGREDLALAKLAEAHWDAVAILAEAEVTAQPGVLYGVWASEIPGEGISMTKSDDGWTINGSKRFCSGLGIVDRALITVTEPRGYLVDVDMRQQRERIRMDASMWATEAFRSTQTGRVEFEDYRISDQDIPGGFDFYLTRSGFWHGGCGVAACWIGGAAGLVDYAEISKRDDPHTLAHLGAMNAALWGVAAALERAGCEIDRDPSDSEAAFLRALRLRHLAEQGCSEILHRLTRAFGPHPLAIDAQISRRYQELDLYLRQSHAERDLETLGRSVRDGNGRSPSPGA